MKKRLIILAFSILLPLLAVLSSFILPFAFAGINGKTGAFWLFISNSGDAIGTGLISLVFCLVIGHYYIGWRRKLLSIALSLLALSLLLGGLALLNETVIKEYFQVGRPYTYYLQRNYEFSPNEFYALDAKKDRKSSLKSFLDAMDSDIDPAIQKHWLSETGYSFPSGHSLNAFLMATVFAYILLFIYAGHRRRVLYLLVLAWAAMVALSRVIVGAHSHFDVSVSALAGILLGYLVILTGVIDRFMLQKSPDRDTYSSSFSKSQ